MHNRTNYIEIPTPNASKAPKHHSSPVHSADNSPKKFVHSDQINNFLFKKIKAAIEEHATLNAAENDKTTSITNKPTK